MSAIMVLLTVIVTLAAVLSGKAPEGREKLYFGSSLLISGGALGAFAATDLFFFYAFHELALIPTFLMIGMLGRGDRQRGRLENHHLSRPRIDHPARRPRLARQPHRHL